jgi:hypothetical protein
MSAEGVQLESVIELVLAFAAEMNTWERRISARSRLENGNFVRDTRLAEAVASLPYDAVLSEYYPIFKKYCTGRERTHGGFPSSWSREGTYRGASRDAVFRSEFEHPDRACVYMRAGQFPDNRFKFVLFRKREGWRIDNAYWGRSDDGPWERAVL